MGYRELLKRYIRFVEAHVGENFIDVIPYAADPGFSEREIGELKALETEIYLDSTDAATSSRPPGFNYRLRLLCMCYGLTLQQAAWLSGIDVQTARRWRTNPRSKRYLAMEEAEFARFERALFDWLENQRALICDGGAGRHQN
jgi:hypothetical protein